MQKYGVDRHRGRIDKLSGRQDVKEKECIPYLKSDLPPSVTLELTTYAGRTTALYPEQTVSFVSSSDGMGEERYSRDQVKIKPLDQFFREAATRPFILRRAQVLSFINARPAERARQRHVAGQAGGEAAFGELLAQHQVDLVVLRQGQGGSRRHEAQARDVLMCCQ